MKAIYASKLFRASKHKDKIKAALANPLNSELVIQLKEYLNENDLNDIQDKIDEESAIEAPDFTEEEINRDAKPEELKEEKEVIRPSQHSSHSAPSALPSKPDHHLSEEVAEFEENRDAELAGEQKKTFDVQKSSDSDKEVAEATAIPKSSIKASETIFTAEELMSTLNTREDTAGVCRVLQKDSTTGAELWIHYNDSVNLNTVMEPVIALLNAAGYVYLDFNRLARTENAIVFTISLTPKPVEPIQEVADE